MFMFMNITTSPHSQTSESSFVTLDWLRHHITQIEFKNPRTAQLVCKLIPPSCPFARTIKLFNRTLLVIPPLCHINPVYEELMELRFRALVFLSETN